MSQKSKELPPKKRLNYKAFSLILDIWANTIYVKYKGLEILNIRFGDAPDSYIKERGRELYQLIKKKDIPLTLRETAISIDRDCLGLPKSTWETSKELISSPSGEIKEINIPLHFRWDTITIVGVSNVQTYE